MACSSGAQSRLLVDTDATFTSGAEAWDFLYCTVSKKRKLVSKRGITGTRSNVIERTKLSTYSVDGRVAFDASPLLFESWLPRILGSAPSGDSFTLAETLPPFYMLLDAVGAIYQYNLCYVDRAVIRAKADPDGTDSLVELVADVAATSETLGISWPVSPPTIPVTANSVPFIFQEGVLTVAGTAYPIHDFMLMIDNHLDRRWVNSVTATEICPQDRTVMLRTNNPFTATEYAGLYNNSSADDGVSATLVFTNGSYSTTFTFSGLAWADNGPEIRGKAPITLGLDFWALKKGTSAELVVTNVS